MAKLTNNTSRGNHFSEAYTDQTAQNDKKSHKKVIIPVAIGAGLVSIWLVGAVTFNLVAMPHTTLNGSPIGWKSKNAIAQEFTNNLSGFTTELKADDTTKKVTGAEVGLHTDAQKLVSDALKDTNPFLWPYKIFVNKNLEVKPQLAYDDAKATGILKTFVENLPQEHKEPKNADLSYNSKKGEFVIEPEQVGDDFELKLCKPIFESALLEMKPTVEFGDECKKQPEIKSDDPRLQKALEKANSYKDYSLKIAAGSNTLATLTLADIQQWMELNKDVELTFNEDAIKKWFDKSILESVTKNTGTKYSYTRPDGKKISFVGTLATTHIDTKALENQLVKEIENKDDATINIPVSQKQKQLDSIVAGPYIDVDLSEQKARYYNGKEIVWESNFVSGNVSKKHSTPQGLYHVNDKKQDTKLIGTMDPKTKKPEYITPVDYWMPFIGNDVGFHDANWRSSFGGDIYQYNGSHGCINLPPEKAKDLFGIIKVGLPVIVHN